MGPEADQEKQGTILEIIRMSTEDGPGLRTTVFFKGCPLRCSWCHNPESIRPEPQVQWIGTKCIGCGTCLEICPEKVLSRTDKGIAINRSLCTGCGTCAEECPAMAMELLGRRWKVSDLADELVKDRAYFEQSGGGVTLSGGEAAMQHEFCLALLKELQKRGIETALDTCGQLPRSLFAGLLPHVDLLLYDLKEIDPEKHRRFTGAGNEKILANLIYAAGYKKTHPSPGAIWIRTPIIPGATDTSENITGIGDFIRANLQGAIERWELCAFNNLCRNKYVRLGMDWPYACADLPEKSLMEGLSRTARSRVSPLTVSWCGSTRLERREDHPSAAKVEKDIVSRPGC